MRERSITAANAAVLRGLARRYTRAARSGQADRSTGIRRMAARWAGQAVGLKRLATQLEAEGNRRAGTKWTVTSEAWRGAVQLSGPGVDDMVQMIAATLADAAHVDDLLHPQWNTYVTARRNRLNAEEHGIEDVGMTELEDAEATAWDALVTELPSSVRATQAEASHIGYLIDMATDQVGQVAA